MPEVGSLLMLFLDFKTLIVHLDNDPLLNGFVSIRGIFYVESNTTMNVSYWEGSGAANVGGTSSRTFADDGGTS